MKYQNLRELLSQPITVKLIKNIIEEKFSIKLPEEGYLAGQSVASAFFELANLDINTVYNDVDIFYAISEGFLDKNNHLKSKFENTLSSFVEPYLYSDRYDHMSLSSLFSFYRVVKSINYGAVNKTFIAVNNEIYNNAILKTVSDISVKLISNFDINSTQVSINLKTNKLVFTEDFLSFCTTKQLRISHWNTPVHSLIRLSKKKEELGPFVYVDYEEARMLSMIYSNLMSNIHYADVLKKKSNAFVSGYQNGYTLFFGEKHLNDSYKYLNDDSLILKKKGSIEDLESDKYVSTTTGKNEELNLYLSKNIKSEYDKYIEFLKSSHLAKEKNLDFQKYIKGIDMLFFSKGEDGIKEMLNKDISKQIFSDDFYRILTIPYTYDSIKKTRKKQIKHFVNCSKLEYTNGKNKKSDLSMSLSNMIVAMDYVNVHEFNKNITDESLIIKKELLGHNMYENLETIESNVKTVLSFAKLLKRISRKVKYPGILYGIFENNTFDLSLMNQKIILDMYHKYLKDSNKELIKNEKNLIDIEFNGYRVKTLNSKLELVQEGDELKHCVGGYGDAVLLEKSLILSVSGKSRFTIELSPNLDTNEYDLIQVRSKFNKKVKIREFVEVFSIISEYFKLTELNNSIKEMLDINPEEEYLLNFFEFKEKTSEPMIIEPAIVGDIPVIGFEDDEIPF